MHPKRLFPVYHTVKGAAGGRDGYIRVKMPVQINLMLTLAGQKIDYQPACIGKIQEQAPVPDGFGQPGIAVMAGIKKTEAIAD